MTNEEAIAKLKYLIGGESNQFPPDYVLEIDVAISALEKQIPKKPRFEDLGYDLHHNVNVYGILCPECGGLIIKCDDDDFGGEFPDAIWKEWDMEAVEINNGYCGHCGQKLDWTEGEEA